MMHPAHDCRVRHRQAAFGHHLDQVSEAEFEAQVPPHARHDDLAIEVPTLKQLIQTWEPGHRPALYSPDGGQQIAPEPENALATPHIGYVARGLYETFSRDIVGNIIG